MKRNNKRDYERFAVQLLFGLILLFSFSANLIGQTEDTEEPVPIVISDQSREQIVRRILTWYFKPRNQKKVIYLAEKGLQNSWLPQIKGVEFQILSEKEADEKESVYFFTEIEKRPKSTLRIGFAFGDPDCSYTGDSWDFSISKQKVKLWTTDEGFGAGCSHSSGNGYGSITTSQSNKSMDVRAK